jgi:hypothetical protein
MADSQDSGVPAQSSNSVQPPTVAEHDGWEVHSASAVDAPKPEEIVERLTDVPGDEQVEQQAKQAQREDREEADEEAAPATEEPRKKSSSDRNGELRARIAAETRAYHDARRAREFEQLEFQRIRQEREQFAKQQQPAPLPNKPSWAKYEEDGKSYEEFLDDRAAYDRLQTIAITRQEIAQREKAAYERARTSHQQQLVDQHADAHEKRVSAAAAQHEDFHELVSKNLSDIPDNPFLVDVIQHHDQGAELLYHLAQHPDEARVLSTLEPSRPVADAIRMSDSPAALLSHFAQHPQELDRLSRMHPATALVALGELKAQIGAAKDGSARTEISNAKPPIRPVGGGRATAPKNSDDLPFSAEWIRRENQRDREKKKTSSYF